MKILVFGYRTLGCLCLEALLDLQQTIVGVVTDIDDPIGEPWFQSMATLVQNRQIPLIVTGEHPADELLDNIQSLRPDINFLFDYPGHLDAKILSFPKQGSINLYASLVQGYRGATPHIWSVMNGESDTAVTLHSLPFDSAQLFGQESVPIAWADTSHQVYVKQAVRAAALLRQSLPAILSGQTPQQALDLSQATIYGDLQAADCLINWHNTGKSLHDLVRAIAHPYAGAVTTLRGQRCRIWQADLRPSPMTHHRFAPGTIRILTPLQVVTGDGLLIPRRLQLEEESEMDAADFLQRYRVGVGDRFLSMSKRGEEESR